MKYALIPAVLAGLVLCALSAGCTSPTQTEIKPVETATLPTAVPTTFISTVVATPVPVETLPAEQYVDLQLSKERPDYTLHLIYNGGKGEGNVVNILMKATLSDGTVVEKYMNDGQRQPRRGDEIIIQGTRGSDRVEVFVTSAGRTYKVLDQPMMTHTL
ncbi:MAG: hypothetical protein ABSG49_00475 [Methanoregula sp.]|jgi:hypothetical protein|uniref:hypothetical protein n=1 Tax=Methanoregula sp. TaxID=2052170 RepID=UPI003C192DDA